MSIRWLIIHTTIYPNEALRSKGKVSPYLSGFDIVLITYPDDCGDEAVMSGLLIRKGGAETAFTYLHAFSDTVPVQDQIQNVGH